MSKVVLYSALVVEAPAGPGMWIIGDEVNELLCNSKDAAQKQIGEWLDSEMWDFFPYPDLVAKTYNVKPGMMFYNIPGTDCSVVIWTEPHNPVDEEGK